MREMQGDSIKEYDLRGKNGCAENPLSRLIKLFHEGEDFVVIVDKSTLPRQLADLFAKRYSYDLYVVSDENGVYRLLFKKKSSTS